MHIHSIANQVKAIYQIVVRRNFRWHSNESSPKPIPIRFADGFLWQFLFLFFFTAIIWAISMAVSGFCFWTRFGFGFQGMRMQKLTMKWLHRIEVKWSSRSATATATTGHFGAQKHGPIPITLAKLHLSVIRVQQGAGDTDPHSEIELELELESCGTLQSAAIAAHYDRHRRQSIIIISYSILSGLAVEMPKEKEQELGPKICNTNRDRREKERGRDI